jgi:3-deoxy-7-phosphoheptulonate synthase
VRIGRIAGQYAKPRSSDHETRDGVTLPSYRGDLVNRSAFTRADRCPDPELMLRGYERAALTINFIRALSSGGFTDLHQAEYWDLGFARHSEHRVMYEAIVQSVRESLRLAGALADVRQSHMQRTQFYTSHEGLALAYEQAQTRKVPRRDGWYNLSTHFPWIGVRTAQLEGAHVEYFRGIRNPIGVKIGPTMSVPWLVGLIGVLNPHDEPGRLTLIHRFGADQVAEALPPIIDAVRKTGKTVTWLVDPMHGNTESTCGGLKTRQFDNVLSEVEQAFAIHAECGSVLGGVHFELTGEDVTECVGGASGLSAGDLKRAYRSKVDPRLNAEQALEMAMLVALAARGGLRWRERPSAQPSVLTPLAEHPLH